MKTATHSARVVALIAALVVFGNAKAWWDLVVLHTTAPGSTFGIGAGIALVLAILLISCVAGVEPASLGLAGGSWRASLRLGLWIGGTSAVTGAALIVGGSLAARSLGLRLVDVTPAASVPWGPLLWRAVLLLWVDTCISGRVGFSGRAAVRAGWSACNQCDGRPAVLSTGVGTGRSSSHQARGDRVKYCIRGLACRRRGPGRSPDLVTISGKLLVIAIGGLLFGGLRVVGRNLLAPVVGHWLFDMAAMIAARFAAGL